MLLNAKIFSNKKINKIIKTLVENIFATFIWVKFWLANKKDKNLSKKRINHTQNSLTKMQNSSVTKNKKQSRRQLAMLGTFEAAQFDKCKHIVGFSFACVSETKKTVFFNGYNNVSMSAVSMAVKSIFLLVL